MTHSIVWPPSITAESEADLAIPKAVLFDVLAAAHITALEVSFDGYGDSGQIESITATGAGNDPVPLPDVMLPLGPRPRTGQQAASLSLSEAIEELAYALLAATQGGWENDEGAYGTFCFDVPARSIRLGFHERFLDTLFSEHQF